MKYDFLYASSDLSILIVEDEELVRKNSSVMIGRRFDKVYEARDGEEGLELYKKYKPDIVISDIKMPKKNGIDMAKEIKEINRDVAIIFLTAFNDVNYLLKSIEIGISHYLIKPVNIKKLFGEIDSAAKVVNLIKHDNENMELFSVLSENSLAGIYMGKEKFEYINPSLEEITGFSKDELLSMDICDIFDDEHKERIGIATKERLRGEKLEVRKNELKIKRKDGSKRWVYSSTTTVHLKNGYSTLGNMIDITEMKNLHLEFERMAVTDQLTGIYNRRKFEELMRSEIERAKRYDRIFSLIMFDLDKFKEINDTYGHIVGDDVIKKSVSIVKGILRFTDSICRWGGEEFFILLPEIALEDAMVVAIKLKNGLRDFDDKVLPKITASFGVVQYEDGNSEDELIQNADKALYIAKSKGRNRVETI